MFIVCEFVLLKHYRFIIKCFDSFHLVVTRDMSLSVVSEGNKGCGVWVMSSSLPQLLGNYITHNCMYGLAVFCRKDPENIEVREGNWSGQEGVGEGERRGVEVEGREGQENLNEEGELFAWESDLDSEDERHSARRSISVALVEGNCMSYNGGKLHAFQHVLTHCGSCGGFCQ